MATLNQLIPESIRRHESDDGPMYGQFATAPGSITEKVYVIIPDLDVYTKFGPCWWQTRDAVSLPNVGDKCLVIFDNRQYPWVIAWWPFLG